MRNFLVALWIILAVTSLLFAEKVTADKLIDMAKRNDPALEQNLVDTLGEKPLQDGTAAMGYGPDFVFAVSSASQPALKIDSEETRSTKRVGKLWLHLGSVKTGTIHKFVWIVDGKSYGGRNDIPAYGPDSYPKPGVQKGTLHGPFVHTSAIYPEMKANFWFYTPAGLDQNTPSPVMIFQDGQGQISHESGGRLPQVMDNLIAEKRIPMMVAVMIQPGMAGQRAMRSIEYDSVTDTYSRYLLQEILPEVQKTVKLRSDGYSRAIAGDSSGGICAFNAAWFKPDEFSRVLSRIGSFTSIQWKPGELDGGNVYPFKIRKEPKRNIRVWLQDGTEDLENNHGSWPMQNLQMANSLKFRDFDYHYSLGPGTHNGGHGNAELPAELTWLWRDYDPSKTSQQFAPDPAEKDKPYWRIEKLNRSE